MRRRAHLHNVTKSFFFSLSRFLREISVRAFRFFFLDSLFLSRVTFVKKRRFFFSIFTALLKKNAAAFFCPIIFQVFKRHRQHG